MPLFFVLGVIGHCDTISIAAPARIAGASSVRNYDSGGVSGDWRIYGKETTHSCEYAGTGHRSCFVSHGFNDKIRSLDGMRLQVSTGEMSEVPRGCGTSACNGLYAWAGSVVYSALSGMLWPAGGRSYFRSRLDDRR
jgi:hypothetical protein